MLVLVLTVYIEVLWVWSWPSAASSYLLDLRKNIIFKKYNFQVSTILLNRNKGTNPKGTYFTGKFLNLTYVDALPECKIDVKPSGHHLIIRRWKSWHEKPFRHFEKVPRAVSRGKWTISSEWFTPRTASHSNTWLHFYNNPRTAKKTGPLWPCPSASHHKTSHRKSHYLHDNGLFDQEDTCTVQRHWWPTRNCSVTTSDASCEHRR